MEKLIELLWEWKPNFDDNNILDYMYSQWTIFIKDWKPVYAYDEDIFPNTELMIISKKEWFIKRLVEHDKINRWKFGVEYTDKQTLKDIYIAWAKEDELLIILLSISENPIEFLISFLI